MLPALRQCLRMALVLVCVLAACTTPSPTAIPTASPEPTPRPAVVVPTSRPAPRPTPRPTAIPIATCPTKAELAYFKEVQRFLQIVGVSATKVGNLFLVMDESVDWAIEVTVEFLALKEVSNRILDLSPPPSVKRISEPAEMAAALIRFGINTFVDGLTNRDTGALETGATIFDQATGEILKVGVAMAAYCE